MAEDGAGLLCVEAGDDMRDLLGDQDPVSVVATVADPVDAQGLREVGPGGGDDPDQTSCGRPAA